MNTDLAVVCSGLVGLLAAWSADLLLGGERPHRGAGRPGAAAQPRRLQVSRVTRGVNEVFCRVMITNEGLGTELAWNIYSQAETTFMG